MERTFSKEELTLATAAGIMAALRQLGNDTPYHKIYESTKNDYDKGDIDQLLTLCKTLLRLKPDEKV